MIDIKQLRENPEKVKKAICSRNQKYAALIDDLLAKDKAYRAALNEVEAMRAESKKISGSIGKLRAEKKIDEANAVMAQANAIKGKMQEKEAGLPPLKAAMEAVLMIIPNLPREEVVVGPDETANKVVAMHADNIRKFTFKPLDHHSVGEKLGILDFETAANLAGARFSLLKGAGARLERAIISFMLDRHTRKGYTEIMPPLLVNAATMTGTGQLPKFEEDLYKVNGEHPLYLIPTAEVPLTNMYRGAMIAEASLPIQMTAYTPCFRQESGSYGKDTRGLIRNHQFNKVELVWITKPEDSMKAFEQLVADASAILAELEIPFRTVELCTGDMGFSSAKTYDLEVWMPSENKFREISSCSNCMDFQARRMGTRMKRTAGATDLVHTLNGSGVAVGRTFAAILENFQNEDGSVSIPKALVPFFGADKIGPVK